MPPAPRPDEPQKAAKAFYQFPGVMNEDLLAILGRPSFNCIRIASLMRSIGCDVPRRAEAEQAAVIHLLLCLYSEHGPHWPGKLNELTRAMLECPPKVDPSERIDSKQWNEAAGRAAVLFSILPDGMQP